MSASLSVSSVQDIRLTTDSELELESRIFGHFAALRIICDHEEISIYLTFANPEKGKALARAIEALSPQQHKDSTDEAPVSAPAPIAPSDELPF